MRAHSVSFGKSAFLVILNKLYRIIDRMNEQIYQLSQQKVELK